MGPKTRECEGDFSPSLRTCVIPIQSSVLAVCCFVAFCWCSKNTRIIGNLEVNETDGLTFFPTSTRRRFLGTFKFVSATFYKNNNLSSCILNEVEKQKYSYQVSQNVVLGVQRSTFNWSKTRAPACVGPKNHHDRALRPPST